MTPRALIVDFHDENVRIRRDETPHAQVRAFDFALGVLERQSLPKRRFTRRKRLAADMHEDARDPATVICGAPYLTGLSLMVAVDRKHIGPIDLEVNRIGRSPNHRSHPAVAGAST